MSKILFYFTGLILLLFFAGCSDKAPACTNISWGNTSSVNEMEPVLMYSAGENCSNYDNYYDGDINSVIDQIKKIKFIKSDECREYFYPVMTNQENYDIAECPDFLPKTIEMIEMAGCEFETPPDSNTDCAPSSLSLFFETKNENFKVSEWKFSIVSKLVFYEAGSAGDEPLNIRIANENVILLGYFANETEVWVNAFWTENGEEKKINALYTVEIID